MTATTGDIQDLALDLQRGVIDKFIQVDSTIARGVAAEGAPVGGSYPLVVVGGPFPVNGIVLNEIDRLLDLGNPQAIGELGNHPPAILDLPEFWLLLLVAKEQGKPLSGILDEWLRSPLGVVPFRDWLVTHGPGQPRLTDRPRYQRHAIRELFGSEGGGGGG